MKNQSIETLIGIGDGDASVSYIPTYVLCMYIHTYILILPKLSNYKYALSSFGYLLLLHKYVMLH